MQNLTRRTALAAVPALAAATGVTTIANAKPDQSKLSPRIAALFAEYHHRKAEGARKADEINEQNDAIRAAGWVNPNYYRMNCRPEGLSEGEWEAAVKQYFARYDAQPEVVQLKKLGEAEERTWDRHGDIAREITGLRAETFGDVQAQFKIWFDYYCDWNLDGSPIGVAQMGGSELRFLLRVSSDISRLAGVS